MKLKFLLKFAVSIFMLALVLRYVNFHSLKVELLSLSIPTIAFIILWYSAGQCISAYKWTLIARAGGLQIRYTTALKAYFIGMFVNCYGFGVVGGDLARGLLLAEDHTVKAEALSSVVADRLHGLTVLALIAALGAISCLILGVYTQLPYLTYSLSALGACMVLSWFIGPKVLLALVPKSNSWRKKIESILAVFPKDPPTLGKITVISVCFHTTQIFLHWFIARMLGFSIPLEYLVVAIPVVNILSTLPISWNGLGVREKSYTSFLAPAVLSNSQAVALGAMWLLAVITSSAIGGIVAFFTEDFGVILKKPEMKAKSLADS